MLESTNIFSRSQKRNTNSHIFVVMALNSIHFWQMFFSVSVGSLQSSNKFGKLAGNLDFVVDCRFEHGHRFLSLIDLVMDNLFEKSFCSHKWCVFFQILEPKNRFSGNTAITHFCGSLKGTWLAALRGFHKFTLVLPARSFLGHPCMC